MTARKALFRFVVLAHSLALLASLEVRCEEPPSVKAKALASLPQVAPAPSDNPTTPAKVALGKQLFFDPRLSGDNTMSCATCHLPDKAFGDGRPTAQGHAQKTLARNTQTLLNVAFYEQFFWDGRASRLEEQALAPIESPDEMNQSLAELEQELNDIPGYVRQFESVFGTKATRDAIAKAIAAFERTLISAPSPFDRHLKGEKGALSPLAKEGLELFTGAAGCVRCHNGPLLSDGQFYRLGVSFQDEGRAAVSGRPAERAKFRTPSLRNVAVTAPFMHDGSMKSLTQVVEYYYRNAPTTGSGLELDIEPLLGQSYSEIPALVAFLESLSGKAPDVTLPELPQ